ncbi:TonB-dependent receptor [Caulobacter sp. 17J65-9]|uniref:TonB-dependent receptor plug domain-containing protein n=1 Tax=Caulobacter sp. 17J65-9 TaxID=2709382 RepID=UPI0013CDB124|nr:TonB-dependent receptor [Caulobacter sp. 17J65-9]NEX93777.1 TonB-dependent receptor [Caulobacter sp. 17J65-9]
MTRKMLFLGAALAPLCLAGPVAAQDVTTQAADQTTTLEELIVTGELAYRDRTDATNPVLSYDLEYFQRFEPISVGEMLKRVPGVTFTSDVLEFDGVSMRGLPPGYTQILINGRRAPGGEADRSFFVDRIPAELVERIEIVRAPSADQPSEGVGGTLNIVLKDGVDLQGGFVKAGTLINSDGEMRPSAAVAYAGSRGDTSFWAGLNYQGRRNPKEKFSDRVRPSDDDDIEYQSDTRDGVDISANAELTQRFANGRLRVSGLIVDTDRDEDEVSRTFIVDDVTREIIDSDGVELQHERIAQRTYALSLDGEFEIGAGQLDFDLGWSGFRDETTAATDEGDTVAEAELDEFTAENITDDEYGAGVAYTVRFGGNAKLKGGVDLLKKTRDGSLIEYDIDAGAVGDPEDPGPGAVYTIEETRIDPFLKLTLQPTDALTVEAGLRYETAKREVSSDGLSASMTEKELNPSLHVKLQASPSDQIRFSVARTVKRPDYDPIAPYTLLEEPADENALVGNPKLKSEKAWGVDLGYEHRIGSRGVVGVNAFYRDISDLVEVIGTGEEIDDGGDIFDVYQARNIGDGKTWGVEFDFSAPLTAVGLPNTGLFANYTWMDSEVRDPFTGQDRRFTNQPHNVYNVGVIHTVESWGASFGATYSDRDMGLESALDETVSVDYDADLEVFAEKRFGSRYVLRFVAANLLDKEKRERFAKYDGDSIDEILDNRANGIVDEYEREVEHSGPIYQITFRAAF